MTWRDSSSRSALAFDPAPLQRCAWCGRPLNPCGPSLWFCTVRWLTPDGSETWSQCQLAWHSAQTTFPAAVDPDLDPGRLPVAR